MAAQTDDEVFQLVQDVNNAAKLPPKSRATNVKPVVASLVSAVYERGLLPDALSEIIDLVTQTSFLDQASLTSILRNLYPATRISRDVTLRVLACLGHGKLKPSLNVQGLLIRWLIMVYHVIEGPADLSQAYAPLFNLLDTAAYRPQLAHLLALITRRRHVRPFRIQLLMNQSRQTGNDPCLVGLLRVFKDYYPEIIVGDAVRGRASAFKHPDPHWRQRLDEIQEMHLQRSRDESSGPRDGFRVHKPLNRALRSKNIPVVQTSDATMDSITLEEIDSADAFARNIDKLEMPNQLVAVLADPLLQKLLLLRPNEEAYRRIANWLNAVLQDVIDGDADEATLWEVLDLVREFVVQTHTLPPVILNFFARFFPLWDGSNNRETIFAILQYAPPHDFEELYEHVFKPLEHAVFDNSAATQLAMLRMYTGLLHHWTTILRSTDDFSQDTSAIFPALVRHVNVLAVTILQTSANVTTDAAILDFYQQTGQLITDAMLLHNIRIELPPAVLIYSLFFSKSLATMSRMCHVLAYYKEGFTTAIAAIKSRRSVSPGGTSSYKKAYVNMYNGYLMDIANCFWRGRAFDITDANTHGCLVPRLTVESLESYVKGAGRSFQLATLLSLSNSPLLCLQSIQAVRDLEDMEIEQNGSIPARHAGPVTPESLTRLATAGGLDLSWHDYRIGVLGTLSAEGLTGVQDLLRSTMTALKDPEGRKSLGLSS